MNVVQEVLKVRTSGRGLLDVTREVGRVVERARAARSGMEGFETGVAHVFIRHTSASLVIQENADPAVLRDLSKWVARIAPEAPDYEHDAEGPDDMPAHLRAAVTKTSEMIPVIGGRLGLGTWQAIYVFEHRTQPHSRELVVTLLLQ